MLIADFFFVYAIGGENLNLGDFTVCVDSVPDTATAWCCAWELRLIFEKYIYEY